MLNKKEAISILTSLNLSYENAAKDGVWLALACGSKEVRRQHIQNEEYTSEKIHSAAIEISRVWRGYHCRKVLWQTLSEAQQHQSTAHDTSLFDTADISEKNRGTPGKSHGLQSSLSFNSAGMFEGKSTKDAFSKSVAAAIIQRSWRRHIDMQVFRYYRDLINFRGKGDPALMLRCINPNEARLLDAASGIHVRFRLAGEKFPPNIYYKIYTHRPVVDMCANSPKDYTKPAVKLAVAKHANSKLSSLLPTNNKDGWYTRYENNGWRLVSDRLIYSSMDSVTWETSRKRISFHHVKLQRKADLDQKRRQRKIDWMKKMYKDGMLRAADSDKETVDLVEKAARGLVNTVSLHGHDAVMDWEVDELLQWTTALNFDDYLETWKESATSNTSERDVGNFKHFGAARIREEPGSGGVPVDFDPYSLTRASSMADSQSRTRQVSQHTESGLRLSQSKLFTSDSQLNSSLQNVSSKPPNDGSPLKEDKSSNDLLGTSVG